MDDLQILQQALLYLKMSELRERCLRLGLAEKGKKLVLIDRILAFVQTGERKTPSTFPESSKAKRGMKYPLHPSTLILKNAYKNDLKTRIFLKSLVGDHFHFTAYGIDWIDERWYAGRPPSYQEFAHFWQSEYLKREKVKVPPKKEWAYINFVQNYLLQKPDAAKDEIHSSWDEEQKRQLRVVDAILSKIRP